MIVQKWLSLKQISLHIRIYTLRALIHKQKAWDNLSSKEREWKVFLSISPVKNNLRAPLFKGKAQNLIQAHGMDGRIYTLTDS